MIGLENRHGCYLICGNVLRLSWIMGKWCIALGSAPQKSLSRLVSWSIFGLRAYQLERICFQIQYDLQMSLFPQYGNVTTSAVVKTGDSGKTSPFCFTACGCGTNRLVIYVYVRICTCMYMYVYVRICTCMFIQPGFHTQYDFALTDL